MAEVGSEGKNNSMQSMSDRGIQIVHYIVVVD